MALKREIADNEESMTTIVDAEDPERTKPQQPSEPTCRQVAGAVVLYAACSSTLLLINAVAVRQVKDPSFVLGCQFIFSFFTCRAIRVARPDLNVELITWRKARSFLAACMVFFICLLANVEALKSVNPETVIVARSCSPIAVAVLEHVALGRSMPNLAGTTSLLAIAAGAFLFVCSGRGMHVEGWTWILIYYVSIVLEMVFVKYIVEKIPMSTWTRVYYNNALSIPMVLLSSVVLGVGDFMAAEWNCKTAGVLILACTGAVSISYAGFHLRKLISATSFTVVGVVCKLITVLINDCMFENHSNLNGHLGILICIGSGVAYERTKSKGKQ